MSVTKRQLESKQERPVSKPETTSFLWNGTFTVTNAGTGEYRTFQISTQGEDAKFAPGERIVALLTGPDNTSDYEGFGFVNGGIRIWNKKKGKDGKPSAHEYYADMLLHFHGALSKIDWTARGYVMEAAKTCRRCGRQLTTPESLTAGIGPVCAGRA